MRKVLLDSTELIDVKSLYGEQDLSKWSLFTGDYINFGYWDCFDQNHDMTLNKRQKSSMRLYEEVTKRLLVKPSDFVLEVGCGIGVGACYIYEKLGPRHIIGLDASHDQIKRATNRNSDYIKSGVVEFYQGYAEKFPRFSNFFHKIFTLEALQHFESVKNFVEESYNNLLDDGLLVISTFLFKKLPSDQFFSSFPNFECGVDKAIILNDLLHILSKNGFSLINVEPIGVHVWSGLDHWIRQTDFSETWNVNWKKAYDGGILDYYIITCKKSKK